jgi:hypothetical protein
MKNKFYETKNKHNLTSLLWLLLYPLLIIPLTAYALIGSFINIIYSLYKYRWKYLTGNTKNAAVNNYFYYNQDLNIRRFGRYGSSPLILGIDTFSLKNWFHVTPLSLSLKAKLGVVFMLFACMIVWLASWYYIIDDINIHITVIFIITITSTYFFVNFIDVQNYNITAWALLPLALFSLISQNYIFFGIIIFLMSFLSFTSIFIFGVISTIFSIYFLTPEPLLYMVPAIIKAFIPIVISIKENALKKIAGGIGIHKKVKYARSDVKISVSFLYILFLNVIFIVNYYISNNVDAYFILITTVCFLYILNSTVSRFADPQTIWILILTTFVFSLINKEPNYIDYAILIFSINPIYYFLGYKPMVKLMSPKVRPCINTQPLMNDLNNLFANVEKNSPVLFAFKNPNNKYSNLFDGYREILQPIEYSAVHSNLSLFPNFQFVFQFNDANKDDDTCWCDTIDDIIYACNIYDVKYVLYYEDGHRKLSDEHLEHFEILDHLDLQDYCKDFKINLLKRKIS